MSELIMKTRKYCQDGEQESQERICRLIQETEPSQIRLFLRWLLCRDQRSYVVDVCKMLLKIGGEIETIVKDEIEAELVVHVAVDLLEEFLKAGFEFHEFLAVSPSPRNDNAVSILWDSMAASTLKCSTSLRLDHRQNPSDRFAYVLITAMIQSCNIDPQAVGALATIIGKYPIHPSDEYTFGKVFRALVVAGLEPTQSFLSDMQQTSNFVPNYYEPYRNWYREFKSCPLTLKQCARVTVRKNVRKNMELASSELLIPSGLVEFLLMRDQATSAVINVDDVD